MFYIIQSKQTYQLKRFIKIYQCGILTLHEFLILFENEAELIAFENQLPLLTIFVPELPEESFSAELWDVNDINQIPDVALRLDNITYTPVIGRDDFNYLVAPEDVPGWPIVVLKRNRKSGF